MDWMTAAPWVAVILSAITFIRGEFRAQDKSYREDIKRIDVGAAAHEERLQRIESEVSHLPGKDLVHALQLSMMELKGQMAVVVERVGPIKAVADRMQELMLEGGRK